MRQLQCCFHNEKGAESLLRKSGGLQVHTDGYSSPSPDGDQGQKQVFIEPFLWPRQFRRYTFEERDLAVLVSRPSMSAIWLVRWMDAQVPVWVPGGRRRLNMGDDPEKGKQKTWSGT